MRYTQDPGVRRKGDSDEYKVVVSVYLTPAERDLWGAGKVRLALQSSGDEARAALLAAYEEGRSAGYADGHGDGYESAAAD